MNTFKYIGHYACECGKEFTNSQSFNGHKSHCKLHLGEAGWAKHQERMQQYAKVGIAATKEKQVKLAEKQQSELNAWVAEQHRCEYCDKIMLIKFGSGRFCSSACAHGYAGKLATIPKAKRKLNNDKIASIKLETRTCLNCGSEFAIKASLKNTFCCSSCAHDYKSKMHYKKYLEDNSVAFGQQNMQCYKKFFLEEQNHKCAICGREDKWLNKKLVFILDHIDGNADNNTRINLRLICPNCDSQLDTYKSKSKHSARAKYRK